MYGAGAMAEPSSSNKIFCDRLPQEPLILILGRLDSPMSPTMFTPGTVRSNSSVFRGFVFFNTMGLILKLDPLKLLIYLLEEEFIIISFSVLGSIFIRIFPK